jgi:hypothetical protein
MSQRGFHNPVAHPSFQSKRPRGLQSSGRGVCVFLARMIRVDGSQTMSSSVLIAGVSITDVRAWTDAYLLVLFDQ